MFLSFGGRLGLDESLNRRQLGATFSAWSPGDPKLTNLSMNNDLNEPDTVNVLSPNPSTFADLRTAGNHAPAERCEVVTDFHHLEELWSEWAHLWASDPRAEIFQTPEWARAWWRSFGRRYTVCSLVVFAADEVVGIVPLVKRDNVMQFLGTPEVDYADILCDEQRAAEVLAVALKTLCESVTGWNECVFQHLSRYSRVFRYYRELPREIRARLRCVPAERYQTIILGEQRDAVFNSLLRKHHTRRRQNKLQKAGRVRFRHLETMQEVEPYLTAFFRHHVRRHALVGRRSACATPEFCQFIRALIQELAPEGWVRFGVLELDSRPLAWHLGFQVNGKFCFTSTHLIWTRSITPPERCFSGTRWITPEITLPENLTLGRAAKRTRTALPTTREKHFPYLSNLPAWGAASGG